MRHFSPRSQVVKWVQRKSIVLNCLPTILPRNARSNGRQTPTSNVYQCWVEASLLIQSLKFFGGLVLVDKCLCVWKGSKFGFARFRSYVWLIASQTDSNFAKVRFTVQKNLSIHAKFNKVRSNSSLNHDELERLDNRFMNASQPLEDDWRKSKISSDIS